MKNKSSLLLFFLTFTLLAAPASGQVDENEDYYEAEGWNNLHVYSMNKMEPHVNVIPYADEAGAENLDYLHSPYCRCLNGEWAFLYYERPSDVPDSVMGENFPLEKASRIQVPGNMELQGYGIPVYANTHNEFRSLPPHAPQDYNPVGCYMRDFDLPEDWDGRRCILRFGAAKSALTLFVNGRYAGYSEDSKTPAEWDITRYLHPGKNRIAAKVYRWCDGSYLECQDMWRMSGITRDVLLYSVPRTYIRDFKAITALDTTDYETGRLDVTVDFSAEIYSDWSTELTLSKEGKTLVSRKKRLDRGDWYLFFSPKECPVGKVEPWSPENPTLYSLQIKLLDANDSVLERVSYQVGFRNVEIKHGLLCLNGKPLLVKGVNRHEHSGTTGHYIPRELMELDARLMKEMGVNAVRTSHYPNDEYWYELCDRMGILVCDEANNESHGQGYGKESLAKNEAWAEVFQYRCNNMVQRDKNHPCVILWSLGNECGNGICMEQAYRLVKQKDPSRPIVNERAELDWNTDIVGIMYPTAEYLSAYAQGKLDSLDNRKTRLRRPYIMTEYCHAMGNSLGGLGNYWDTIAKYDCLQGGFIWDWVDQSLQRDTIILGAQRSWMALGGDLGSLPGIRDDDAFCANGILGSDRNPHPHAEEVKAVYAAHAQTNPHILLGTEISQPDYASLPPIQMASSASTLILHNDIFSVEINRHNGYIENYTYQGFPLIASPIRWNFWRPPTLNDLKDIFGAPAWEGLDRLQPQAMKIVTPNRSKTDSSNMVATSLLIALKGEDGQEMLLEESIRTYRTGDLEVCFSLAPQQAWRTLPKMGIQMGIDTAQYPVVTFEGNLAETYPDRREAQHWGLWEKSTREMASQNHPVPQESGNHEAVWSAFYGEKDGKPCGFMVRRNEGAMFNFSLRDQEDSTLTKARRQYELSPIDHYVLSIDHLQAGLGTATCGPGVAARYRIPGDTSYSYNFVFHPFQDKESMRRAPLFAPMEETTICQGNQPERSIHSIEADQPATAPYDKLPLLALGNGTRGIAGNYGEDWLGFFGKDSTTFLVKLARPMNLGEVAIGFCHHADDWVMAPKNVEIQWSKEGTKWSEWSEMELPRPLASPQVDFRRVRWIKHFEGKEAKKALYLRIRVKNESELPKWHNSAGKPAWMMVDEIEVTPK